MSLPRIRHWPAGAMLATVPATPDKPMPDDHRIEHDFLGEKRIPAGAYWGVHTARAVENFPISGARERLVAGEHHDQFVVDAIQGGAGTSTNMNANEVIANLALEKMGFEKGRYDALHPNDHVNASQSTNDVYPPAVRLALWTAIDALLHAMAY